MKIPLRTHCQACKEVQGTLSCIQKPSLSPGAGLKPSHPGFFPRQRNREILAFSCLSGKTTSSLGQLHCSWICPLPFSPIPFPHHPCVTPNKLPKSSANALITSSKRKGSYNPVCCNLITVCTSLWQQQKKNIAGINISTLVVNQGLSFLLLYL